MFSYRINHLPLIEVFSLFVLDCTVIFSCYANAVLQCLAFTPPLTAYLLQGLHSKSCMYAIIVSYWNHHALEYCVNVPGLIFDLIPGANKKWCFTCEFESLILKSKDTKSPISPVGLLSQLQNIGSQLGNGREEDAHEFLRCYLHH